MSLLGRCTLSCPFHKHWKPICLFGHFPSRTVRPGSPDGRYGIISSDGKPSSVGLVWAVG
jgi:hypothetical protein